MKGKVMMALVFGLFLMGSVAFAQDTIKIRAARLAKLAAKARGTG